MSSQTYLLTAGVAVLGLVAWKLLFGGSGAGRRRIEAQRKIKQSVEVSPASGNSGGIRRNPVAKDKIVTGYDPKIKTLVDIFNASAKQFPQESCLGKRKKEGNTVGPYEWMTYSEVQKQRDIVASGFVALGLKPRQPVGLYSINRPEWIIADLAASTQAMPSVALYDTLGPDAVEYIINHAELSLVVSSAGKQLQNLFAAKAKCDRLKTIVSMDPVDAKTREEASKLKIDLYEWNDLLKLGKEKPVSPVEVLPEDIYTIMYTSGTTGNPKGVVLTHGNGVAEVASVRFHEEGLFDNNDVHMSYLPLAHSFERAVAYVILSAGAKIGYFQGAITELFNDIAELRPTFLVGAPRVWNRLQDKVKLTVSQGSPLRQKLFHYAYGSKKAALDTGDSTWVWDKLVFSKTKARLGGRVKWILSGSAPLDPKLAEFLKICFSCPILEGYGLTETFAGSFITHTDETQFGHVGSPLSCLEVKLQDVPEMDSYSKNNPPKGEILIRGANIYREYYKDKKQTEEVLEKDGWFHTGDIGRWNENGTLSIVDRKKNIFKLEQGEYVAVEYLEGVYIQSKFVSQIWVYGSSFKRYLVAIVVPDYEVSIPWAKEKGLPTTQEELVKNEAFKKAIQEDLNARAKETKLSGFEYVKAIALTNLPFTVEDDTMTPTFKLRRPQLLKRFQGEVDRLYDWLEKNPPAGS